MAPSFFLSPPLDYTNPQITKGKFLRGGTWVPPPPLPAPPTQYQYMWPGLARVDISCKIGGVFPEYSYEFVIHKKPPYNDRLELDDGMMG